MDNIIKLESEEEGFASNLLGEICYDAIIGSQEDIEYLEKLFGEKFDTIQMKISAEGSTFYVWWMNGVRKFMKDRESR